MRIPIRKPVWEIFSSTELDITAARAVELGWAENKVQVRKTLHDDVRYYMIELYDGCDCPMMVKYDSKYIGEA
jgi:hypothetical protein